MLASWCSFKFKEGGRGMKYKCGYTTSGCIILDDNILSTAKYLQWAEEEGNLELSMNH